METVFSKAKVFRLDEIIAYSEGGVVSKQLLQNENGSITLFSFDQGQGLSEHTAPFDAFVQVLEGEVEITIGGKPLWLKTGDDVIMPAHLPHALKAVEPFKMLLTMIREPHIEVRSSGDPELTVG